MSDRMSEDDFGLLGEEKFVSWPIAFRALYAEARRARAEAATLAERNAALGRMKQVRVCEGHYNRPDERDYGNEGCVICLLNRAEQAEAKSAALEREVEGLRGKLEEIQEEVGDAHYADDVDLGRVRRALRAALSPPKETP